MSLHVDALKKLNDTIDLLVNNRRTLESRTIAGREYDFVIDADPIGTGKEVFQKMRAKLGRPITDAERQILAADLEAKEYDPKAIGEFTRLCALELADTVTNLLNANSREGLAQAIIAGAGERGGVALGEGSANWERDRATSRAPAGYRDTWVPTEGHGHGYQSDRVVSEEQIRNVAALKDAGDEVTRFLKMAAGGRTYLEVYLNIAGMDRVSLLNAASDRHKGWSVADDVNMTHDAIIKMRPKLIEKMHPFFISGAIVDDMEEHPPKQEEKLFMIDTPFPTIWMEAVSGNALFFLASSQGLSWIVGILCHEVNAGRYLCEALLATSAKGIAQRDEDVRWSVHTIACLPTNSFGRIEFDPVAHLHRYTEGSMIQTATHDVLYWTFRRFRSDCAFANEKVSPIRMRVGTGADRTKVKINHIVRVMLKSERKVYERAAGRVVDWSHKWEVMGHWRKVDGIGKDRDGAYTVRGQTWVSPHTKGKGNLVKKSRVVVDGDGKTPQDQG